MPLPLKIIVHLICLLLGGGLGVILISDKSDRVEAESVSQQRLPSLMPRPGTSTKDRVQVIIDEEKRSRASITDVTVREFALQWIEEAPAQLEENQKQFAIWLAAAKRLEKTSDLGRVLTQALSDDDEDSIGAVMVAWFQRNPSEAFDQFRIRPALMSRFYDGSPLWHAVDLAQMKEFVQGTTMPKYMRGSILEAYVSHLADFGNLDGFLDLLSELKGYEARNMAWHFRGGWIPVDPETAASVIHRHLDSPSMALLMEGMLEGVPNPEPLWTEAFGKALLAKPLGSLESKRSEIEGELERIDNSLGDSFYFQRDDAVVLKDASFPESILNVIEVHLSHDADWQERFARGESDISEIEEMLVSRIPESSDHRLDFHKAMLQKLWIHQPMETIAWARGRMDAREVAEGLTKVLEDLDEPRASRRAVLLESMEGLEFNQEKVIEWIESSESAVDRWHKRLETRGVSE